ncbi:kinase-like protein [Lindgomyces ingoldianus]|uniref:Kinase-like protein n=1 Tax=Lindgomyces ingoldianus TaxID=673940 RepID=A0ACB6R6P3_9PLEO|nr:kinase-like protein [Lindgomyces ingoldianus]KAF2474126.1 kinase-like protein [Lindgomyces ingoldianus]
MESPAGITFIDEQSELKRRGFLSSLFTWLAWSRKTLETIKREKSLNYTRVGEARVNASNYHVYPTENAKTKSRKIKTHQEPRSVPGESDNHQVSKVRGDPLPSSSSLIDGTHQLSRLVEFALQDQPPPKDALYRRPNKLTKSPTGPSVQWPEDRADAATSSDPTLSPDIRLVPLEEKYGWKYGHQVYGSSDEEPLIVCNILGHGSLGIVEEVKIKGGALPTFVRKRVQLPVNRRRATLKVIQEEAKALESLTHPHIVTMLGSYEVSKQNSRYFYCLLMSPVGDNDLKNFLDTAGEGEPVELEWKVWVWKWFGCLVSALAYMHNEGIRHQDIKPSNIIHRGSDIFFTDFSSSCRFEVGRTTSTEDPSRSSPMYSAPEVVERFSETGALRKHGRGSDIFALGCVYCDMLSVLYGRPVSAFHQFLRAEAVVWGPSGPSAAAVGDILYSRKIDFIHKWITPSPFFDAIIAPMLAEDRALRPSAAEVREKFLLEQSRPPVYCSCMTDHTVPILVQEFDEAAEHPVIEPTERN